MIKSLENNPKTKTQNKTNMSHALATNTKWLLNSKNQRSEWQNKKNYKRMENNMKNNKKLYRKRIRKKQYRNQGK
jgi:hypothetical protein